MTGGPALGPQRQRSSGRLRRRGSVSTCGSTRASSISRAPAIKALVEAGDVLVDGRRVKVAHRLKPAERVEVHVPPPPPEELRPEAIPLAIVFEDEHVLVVDKPAGMVTHPGAGRSTGTLAAAALAHAPTMAGVGGPRRPGIVHRLDKGTSGLIVLAKTPVAYEALTAQLARRSVTRRYVCLVHGVVTPASGVIDRPIGRDERSRVRMAVAREGRGKRAVTRFRVLERFPDVDLPRMPPRDRAHPPDPRPPGVPGTSSPRRSDLRQATRDAIDRSGAGRISSLRSTASPCTRPGSASSIPCRESGSSWCPLFPTELRESCLIFAANLHDRRGAVAPSSRQCIRRRPGIPRATISSEMSATHGRDPRRRRGDPHAVEPPQGAPSALWPAAHRLSDQGRRGRRGPPGRGDRARCRSGGPRREGGERRCLVEQKERLGTGHALLQARGACAEDSGVILVLPGDMPLLSEATLGRLVAHHRETEPRRRCSRPSWRIRRATVASCARTADPSRSSSTATPRRPSAPSARSARARTASMRAHLWPALSRVKSRNQQGEYYLTDVIGLLPQAGCRVEAVKVDDPREGLGVNDRRQLAELTAVMRRRILDRLMVDGVTDPGSRQHVRGRHGRRRRRHGAPPRRDPRRAHDDRRRVRRRRGLARERQPDRRPRHVPAVLRAARIHSRGSARPSGPSATCGRCPTWAPGAKIGNFVELKKSRIGRGAKVPHLSYVGDATLGADVNFGAGAITCNYDGVAKHETVVGDGAFIGTNSSLMAPDHGGRRRLRGRRAR